MCVCVALPGLAPTSFPFVPRASSFLHGRLSLRRSFSPPHPFPFHQASRHACDACSIHLPFECLASCLMLAHLPALELRDSARMPPAPRFALGLLGLLLALLYTSTRPPTVRRVPWRRASLTAAEVHGVTSSTRHTHTHIHTARVNAVAVQIAAEACGPVVLTDLPPHLLPSVPWTWERIASQLGAVEGLHQVPPVALPQWWWWWLPNLTGPPPPSPPRGHTRRTPAASSATGIPIAPGSPRQRRCRAASRPSTARPNRE